jgi:c-di-GMP-binding flagellar brake protein YcgR
VLTRYWDRRRYIRVPVSEPVRWRSGRHAGHCELLDISPGGAGLRISARRAGQLGPTLDLELDLPHGDRWQLATAARVVRVTPDDDNACLVGVEFG